MQTLIGSVEEGDISEDTEEILFAKAHCFAALSDALEFKQPDFEKLDNARKTFEKLNFDASIVAVNSLDSIIRVLNKQKSLESIPKDIEGPILHQLDDLTALDGAITGRIPIKKKHYTSKPAKIEEPEVVYHFIDNTTKPWVRVCLVQLDFSLDSINSPNEFGYTLKEREKTKDKIFEALKIASENEVDIICFPELSTTKEWVQQASEYKNPVIIFGTYYRNGFNTCPILVHGKDYYIQKINPSPEFETEIIHGIKMKQGKKIFVFQTMCGVFAVLICIDYMEEIHRILRNQDEKIKNIDFIIVPEYNKSVEWFQKQGDLDCQKGDCPYVIQVNSWKIKEEEVGGTCIIGTEHRDALERYKTMRLKPDDSITYKLIESKKESITIVDLDIKRKGVPVPAKGPKMKVFKRYIYKNGWELAVSNEIP